MNQKSFEEIWDVLKTNPDKDKDILLSIEKLCYHLLYKQERNIKVLTIELSERLKELSYPQFVIREVDNIIKEFWNGELNYNKYKTLLMEINRSWKYKGQENF